MKNAILSQLPADYRWRGVLNWLDTVDSTNTRAKKLAQSGAPHGTALIADCQTGGRGRMGRSFHSPAGSGIYLSMILRPNCPAGDLMHLTCAAAVAAADGIQTATGLHPGIKWTNDLVVERKKLGGILTELSVNSSGIAEYAIVGIGINCTQMPDDFPEDIRSIATSLRSCAKKDVDRAAVIAGILMALQEMFDKLHSIDETLSSYRKHCITLGQEISLVRGDEVCHGIALDIDAAGALVVQFDNGQRQHVSSGEVSVRGMYGYV